ncbi:hypothetical protein AQJ11_39005 [Streptomyces corchorusii]|uniref:Uncharacterized protein n=2 Tax=Streptomyces TaxID=1883 RepID=A0A117Q9Y7_STRCK|nr:hypothetical protein [Streptomyces corchorusii]KUN16782.1 hypothetical protein AQJ11_39005 [Streptomyces corchorusii]
MPKSENTGTTKFTRDTLYEFGTSDKYLPGMRRQSLEHQHTLQGYKDETGKVRAGNPSFAPAKALEDAFVKACEGANAEFVFNDTMLMSFTETMRGNHAAFEEVEEKNLEDNKKLGQVVSQDLQARMANSGGTTGIGGTGGSPGPNTGGTNAGSGNTKP